MASLYDDVEFELIPSPKIPFSAEVVRNELEAQGYGYIYQDISDPENVLAHPMLCAFVDILNVENTVEEQSIFSSLRRGYKHTSTRFRIGSDATTNWGRPQIIDYTISSNPGPLIYMPLLTLKPFIGYGSRISYIEFAQGAERNAFDKFKVKISAALTLIPAEDLHLYYPELAKLTDFDLIKWQNSNGMKLLQILRKYYTVNLLQ